MQGCGRGAERTWALWRSQGLGTAIGGIVGCAVGGFIGYEAASSGAGRAYDWAENTIFTPVPASDTP
jgi:hypothetical protein